ncbi:hypothetical protein QR680_013263 [Steinernema hermaphroditum]|uniref:AB hydrolase-1 domain-containing protein n=1 Tax=Steinernema hermaphroditum TaxID=289476 RepID=A0AA39I4X3_9BILA|nr:hypothetical protein QR680_013263 [Steinernema hermaphroditum]
MRFSISKPVSLLDEDVEIVAEDLLVAATVRFVLTLLHIDGKFESWAEFRASSSGIVCFSRDAPLQGSYRGVDAMGLFSSIAPADGRRCGSVLNCSAIAGLLLPFQLVARSRKGEILGQTTILKRVLDPSIQRLEVSEGNIRGVLFRPKGNQVHGAVIDMYGLGGGCREHRAALLAEKGFVVLALGLFNYRDRPKRHNDVDILYIKEAIDWITSLTFASQTCALVGHSLGGLIAFLAALRYKKINAVVAINAPSFVDAGLSLLEDGRRAETYLFGPPQAKFAKTVDGEVHYVHMWNHILDSDAASIAPFFVPLEEAPEDIAFFLIAGEKDNVIPSARLQRRLEGRLRRNPRRRIEAAYLEHSGHMVEPPHLPHVSVAFTPPLCWSQGGDRYLQCVDQRTIWPKIQRFLKEAIAVNDDNSKL